MEPVRKCTQPDCDGEINAYGECETCGAAFDAPVVSSRSASSIRTAASASVSMRSGVSSRSKISTARSTQAVIAAHPSTLRDVLGADAGVRTPDQGQTTTSKRTRQTIRTTSASRDGLGLGWVDLVAIPPVDPLSIVRDLTIPDDQRVCHKCQAPLVRRNSSGEVVVRKDRGVCPKCPDGTPYDFTPLPPGTLVSGQYEVKGPIAIGGCGFVYLAWDVNVGVYVILKGLINSRDPEAAQNAMQERHFLALLRHPCIVTIVNFVTHNGQPFTVMEFIDGKTLKSIRANNRAAGSEELVPLDVDVAISYILGILPAYAYLHGQKPPVIYCDGKADNFMVQFSGSVARMRLIDMGGAYIFGSGGDMFRTQGFCSPQQDDGLEPDVTDDIFTIGRTLAWLICNFDWRSSQRYTIPTPPEEPLFAEFESLYRFLQRATARQREDRFQSIDEMESQLRQILREIVSRRRDRPIPLPSELFGPDTNHSDAPPGPALLPAIAPDTADPANQLIQSALTESDPALRLKQLRNAIEQFPASTEAPIRIADVLIDLNQFAEVERQLDSLAGANPYDWRVAWCKGKLMLALGQPKNALRYFDAVYSELPGESPPKLAMALSAELSGDLGTAIRLYDVVSSVDPSYFTAAFGLARCVAAEADENSRQNAVLAYARVPKSSLAVHAAAVGTIRILIGYKPKPPAKADLAAAAATLESLPSEDFASLHLRADILLSAIGCAMRGAEQQDPGTRLLGTAFVEESLRVEAESTLRRCARLAENQELRVRLVDEANGIRPLTRT